MNQGTVVKNKLTPKEIERGLTDNEWFGRWQWAKKLTFTPNEEQVERGLTDENESVRWRWAVRLDFAPTKKQIERGLTDKFSSVKLAWAGRIDFTPTTGQIVRGLTDKDSAIWKKFSERPDLFLEIKVLDRVIEVRGKKELGLLPPEVEQRLRAAAEAAALTKAVVLDNSDVQRNHLAL